MKLLTDKVCPGRGRVVKTLSALTLVILATHAFGEAHMVKDISPGSAPTSSWPRSFVEYKGNLYFVAEDEMNGAELWKFDGNQATLVKDICTGPGGGMRSYWTQIAIVDDLMVFPADDGIHGYELWRSDGTAEGTYLLKDTNEFGDGLFSYTDFGQWISVPVVIGDTAYFVVREPSADDFWVDTYQLWKTDGSEKGTVRLGPIDDGNNPPNVFVIHGELYARTEHGYLKWNSTNTIFESVTQWPPITPEFSVRYNYQDSSSELWKDSVLLKEFQPYESLRPLSPTNSSELIFAVNRYDSWELWRSDGTPENTLEYLSVNSQGYAWFSFGVTINGVTFFSVSEGNVPSHTTLWRTDGTVAGTFAIKKFAQSTMELFASVAHGVVYFAGTDPVIGSELWKTDGTADGTLMCANIASDLASTYFGNWSFSDSAVINNLFFFTAWGATDHELWRSDGTDVGTFKLANSAYSLQVAGNYVFFVSDSQIWRTDGSPTGTLPVVELVGIPESPLNYAEFCAFGDFIVFKNWDIQHGLALWRNDGSVGGTQFITTLPDLTNYIGLLHAQDSIYFTTNGGSHLWRTDGTIKGTYELHQSDYLSYDLAADGKSLRFQSWNIDLGMSTLWITDGTAAGTRQVTYDEYVQAGSFWYFIPPPFVNDFSPCAGYDSLHGMELWKTDGSPEGKHFVQDLNPGGLSSNPWGFTLAGNNIFFTAYDSVHGRELWVMPVSDLQDPPAPVPTHVVATQNQPFVLNVSNLSPISVSGLPAGLFFSGGVISGVPTKPGEFSIVITSAAGTQVVLLQVNAATLPETPPVTPPDGGGPLPEQSQPLKITRLQIHLNFMNAGHDGIICGGSFNPKDRAFGGKTFVFNCAGFSQAFSTNNAGVSRTQSAELVCRAGKTQANAELTFKLKLRKAEIPANLATAGSADEDLLSDTLTLPIEINFAQQTFESQSRVRYRVKQGRVGNAVLDRQ